MSNFVNFWEYVFDNIIFCFNKLVSICNKKINMEKNLDVIYKKPYAYKYLNGIFSRTYYYKSDYRNYLYLKYYMNKYNKIMRKYLDVIYKKPYVGKYSNGIFGRTYYRKSDDKNYVYLKYYTNKYNKIMIDESKNIIKTVRDVYAKLFLVKNNNFILRKLPEFYNGDRIDMKLYTFDDGAKLFDRFCISGYIMTFLSVELYLPEKSETYYENGYLEKILFHREKTIYFYKNKKIIFY